MDRWTRNLLVARAVLEDKIENIYGYLCLSAVYIFVKLRHIGQRNIMSDMSEQNNSHGAAEVL